MSVRRFIDIGANLTDFMFNGLYHGTQKHKSDLLDVLNRSWSNGLEKIIITGGSLEDSKRAIELSKLNDKLFCTAGCHPTRCQEFDVMNNPEQYLQDLNDLIIDNKSKVVAFGECGLDYDRLEFCPKDIQLKYFQKQMHLNDKLQLPLFLHCRNAFDDLFNVLKNFPKQTGVVHSFDGTKENVDEIINLGFYIGINGCSLKTDNNLEVVKYIPINRLMIETDCPWCEIRPSHASSKYVTTIFQNVKKEKWQSGVMVKNRNEPSNIVQILEVISSIKNVNSIDLCQQIFENTENMFFKN